jgi:uncharacterized protein YfaT (DUF1175 family)
MASQTKSRLQRLLVAGLVALAILLLLLRLVHFVQGHGGGRPGSELGGGVKMASFHAEDAHFADRRWTQLAWTDRFGDGTPDFLRLADPADRAAFRVWFTSIADYQAVRPPAEIVDCASLLRYAYREALRRHDDTWFAATGVEMGAPAGEIRAWRYPETPLGAGLFRVRPGSFVAEDTHNGAFAQFADAKTLVERNTYLVTRDVLQAEQGDLLFYRQFGQSSPWHSMIVTRIGGQPAVVYDTGEIHGKAGELRRVLLAELLEHPQAQWRPVAGNPNFLGVYRWNILRGTL